MWRQHAAAAAVFIVLSIVMTWPLLPNLGRAVAHPTDPFLNTWILDWDWYGTLHQPLSLFEANACWPAHDSLAFSENLYGIAVLLFPFRAVGVSPLVAYNLALVAAFAFSGFGAYLLGWQLTRSWWAGIAAGVFHAFVPFRFTHSTQVQHIWAGWLPLLVFALLNYVDASREERDGAASSVVGDRSSVIARFLPRRGRSNKQQPTTNNRLRAAALFGFVFLMNGLTNIHWLLFGTVAIGATALLLLWAGVRRWKELAVATMAAGILLLAFLIPYWRVANLYGMARSWMETKAYSATWRDWLVSNVQNHTYRALIDVRVDPERWLFPGFLSLLAAAGALLALRRSTRAVVIGWLWVAIGVLGSLGLNGFFHSFLFDAVPGFRAIRAPARWAEIAYVGLAMLIAAATALVSRGRRWPGVLVAIAFAIELRSVPVRWFMALPDAPAVYRWLAAQPMKGAVLELPLDTGPSEYLYLLRATAHHQKTFNGISPLPDRAVLSSMSKASPIPDTFISELRRLQCETVVVHADTLEPYQQATVREWLRRELNAHRLSFVARFDAGGAGDWVFSLSAGRPTAAELEAFLGGRPTPNGDTFGVMNAPAPVYRGAASFSGFAFSPYGVRSVVLLFDSGAVRFPAVLAPDPALTAAYPFYPRTPKPRFVCSFRSRPRSVSNDTDVQAEILDGRGRRVRLPFYWMRWE